MSDEEDFVDSDAMSEDDSGDMSDANSELFDAPQVAHQESSFLVLGPEECEAQANKAVSQTCELRGWRADSCR